MRFIRVACMGLAAACATTSTDPATLKPSPSPIRTLATPIVQAIFDCEHASMRPTEILLACGDGSESITVVSYASWSDGIATGSGTVLANDFKPDRATGHNHAYPATISLDKTVRTQLGLIFTRATVRYPHTNPYGHAFETWTFGPRQ
jgi:hypothetical protein